jgi:aryl-alcohol dehydrogenase-like predicted oxidoreductase
MRLALGTVQFGTNYGVANVSGQVSPEQAAKILAECRSAGIDTLDTAVAYGDSEERLGNLGVQDWKVISKLPPLPGSVVDVREWARLQVRDSLYRLRVDQLDGLLLHRPSDILGPTGGAYARALQEIKDEGLAVAIGFSIYSPDELEALCSALHPDIIQAPYNMLDRRLVSSGWMDRLGAKGVRIHTRSAFLQGALLFPATARPPWFDRWQSLWQALSDACALSELTPLDLSLGFVLAQPAIERVVVGVDSVSHIRQVIAAAKKPMPSAFPDIESHDLELIEPTRWKTK